MKLGLYFKSRGFLLHNQYLIRFGIFLTSIGL